MYAQAVMMEVDTQKPALKSYEPKHVPRDDSILSSVYAGSLTRGEMRLLRTRRPRLMFSTVTGLELVSSLLS